ncbi:MAG: hypothetical protein ACC652_14980, partial [Acidimicrobiales bacterium]
CAVSVYEPPVQNVAASLGSTHMGIFLLLAVARYGANSGGAVTFPGSVAADTDGDWVAHR